MPRRPDWVDDDLYPFEDHWATVDGHELHHLDEGHGPPLLLLHGNPTWSFLYRHLVLRLRDRFRCVVPDLPGFGLSEAGWGFEGTAEEHADALTAFVDHLDLRDAVVFGQDWGGPLGFALASRRPDRFRGCVVANTWAWPVAGDPRYGAFSRLAGNALTERLNVATNALPALAMRSLLQGPVDPVVLEQYRAPFRRPDDRRLPVRLARSVRRSRGLLEEAAAGVTVLSGRPAAIVWGARDPAFRERERHRFEQAFPDAPVRVLERAGHFVQEDAPDAVAGVVREAFATGAEDEGSVGGSGPAGGPE